MGTSTNIYSPHFIGEYKNALSDDLCDTIINYADQIIEARGINVREDPTNYGPATYRKDWAVMIHSEINTAIVINEALDHCLKQYMDEFLGLFYNGRFISTSQKLQVSPPTGGFHSWHCENGTINNMGRVAAWMFYLNDMPDGEGETEFLHQRCRIKAEKGKCVIFPAGFTHIHRANPPLTTTKYIVTGWWDLAQTV